MNILDWVTLFNRSHRYAGLIPLAVYIGWILMIHHQIHTKGEKPLEHSVYLGCVANIKEKIHPDRVTLEDLDPCTVERIKIVRVVNGWLVGYPEIEARIKTRKDPHEVLRKFRATYSYTTGLVTIYSEI